MSKQFWHTKTLFKQNWTWKFKWSYKFDYCQSCLWVKFKHKGRWLCTACWDKERDKNKNRLETKRKAWLKWHKENYKPVEVRKKKIKIFDLAKYRKEYYEKNIEVLKLKAKAYRMRKKWLFCMQMIIRWKIIYLPFSEMLEKPTTTWLNFKKYDEWKEQQRQFNLIRNYYNK